MSESVLDQAAQIATAFGIVAAVAGPLAGVACVAARGEVVLPPWRRWHTPLTGFDVFVLFLASQLVLPVWVAVFDLLAVPEMFPNLPADADAGRVTAERRFWTGVCAQAAALPTLVLVWRAVHRFAAGRWGVPAPRPRRFAADVVAGTLTWAVITPVCFAVYFAVLWLQQQLGGVADEHPLKRGGAGESAGRVVAFFAAACVFPAAYEELVFRRTLLPWAVGPTHRAWLVLTLALGLTAIVSHYRTGPLVFAALLCGGLYVLRYAYAASGRLAVRTAGGIYATAALFGLLHSQVWPTPVPLFVFGLGVGYVAARTQSIWPAVVAHGLFNAVSAVHVLRGSG